MKKIIITGSSSGFGLLAARTLASQGHTVYATMRNVKGANAAAAKGLEDWAQANKADVKVVELDITSETSVQEAINNISKETGGKIDVLINNAGISFIGVSESLTNAQANQLFQVNVLGTDRTIKAVLPYMHPQKDGLIINVSSVQARHQIPLLSMYNATKAAVDALSVGYHYELRSSGIEVVVIQPGGYPTTDITTKGIQAGNPAAEKHYGADMATVKQSLIAYFTPKETDPDPQEVADKIAELIAAPKGSRPLWTLVGAGPLEALFDQVNQSTKTIVDTSISYMGVQ